MIQEGLEAEKLKEPKKKRGTSPWVSVVLLLLVSLLYTFPLDNTFALWVWPAFVFAIPGLMFSLFVKKWKVFLIAGWVLFSFAHVTETRTMFRAGYFSDLYHSKGIGVATLNCAGGSTEAAMEALETWANLILLQESPGKEDLVKAEFAIFEQIADIVSGPDASIIAMGKLEQVPMPKGTGNFVAARWTFYPNKEPYNVVSLRLTPPVMRIDLFDPSAWEAFARNRQTRREEVLEIARKLKAANFKPDIIGGDFNTPPDHDILKPLTEGMADVFAVVGSGYGATCVNPYPCMVRIDHVYVSNRLKPERAQVIKTEHSDHRLVLAELSPEKN